MTPEERRAEALRLKSDGMTYQEIGNEFGISRQRAQQLCAPLEPVVTGDCGQCGATAVLHRHHVTYVPAVIQSLCASCHRKTHTPPSELIEPIEEHPMENIVGKFSEHLVKWRDAYKLTQSQAAKLIGVSVRTLQDWEQDRRTPGGLARATIYTRIGNLNGKKRWQRKVKR